MVRRIFITVAEVSGDQHAAQLIRRLRELDPQVLVEGHGGRAMRDAGATIHGETVVNAAMGLHGAGRAMEMYKLLRWTRNYYRQNRPDLHICIDSSSMNLPFAQLASRNGVPVLYYIAPQLWASRPWRIRKLRRVVDRVACILPFEEEWYRGRRVDATFVGHPLFDELPPDRLERMQRLRTEPGRFPNGPPVIGIIPGSRKSEVAANFPPLLEVMQRLRQVFPGTRFVIPTTEATHGQVVALAGAAADIQIAPNAFNELISQSDLCLCKSGTSTLHVAAYHVPMIVVYRFNRWIWKLARHLVLCTPKIALVNILAGNIDLVPEIIPWYGSSGPVADMAVELLTCPEKLERQRQKLRELVTPLDKPGASMNAARIALGMIENKADW